MKKIGLLIGSLLLISASCNLTPAKPALQPAPPSEKQSTTPAAPPTETQNNGSSQKNSGTTSSIASSSPQTTTSDWDKVQALNAQLHVLTPPNGSQLCLGQPLDIKWEVPPNLTTISLFIEVADSSSQAYKIGTFPASYGSSKNDGKGHYVWPIGGKEGNAIPPSAAYHILLTTVATGPTPWGLHNSSPGTFSVNDCINPNSPKY